MLDFSKFQGKLTRLKHPHFVLFSCSSDGSRLHERYLQSNLVIPDLAIPDYIHFPPYTGELSKTEQG
jgi:hypothetical protein